MRVKRLGGLIIFCCSFAAQMQTFVFADSLIEEGERHYTDSNYGKALTCFEAAVKANPKNALAHYLLANTLAVLNRRNEARAEYEHATKLESSGPIYTNCMKALKQFEAPLSSGAFGNVGSTSSASPKSTTSTGSTATSTGSTGTSTNSTATSTASPRTEASDIQNSATKIGAQTNETEARASEECEARIRDVNRDAERKIADLDREQTERIQANTPIGYGRGIFRYNPTNDNNAIKREIDARKQAVKDDQAKKIAELRQIEKSRYSAAEDAAITLDKQYVDRNRPGSVKLAPTGTSIYVRSYETSDEPSGTAVPVALPPAKALGNTAPAQAHTPTAPAHNGSQKSQ